MATSRADFGRELLGNRVLIGSGVGGLYGRGPVFMRVLAGIEGAIQRAGSREAVQRIAFPPLIPRELLRRVGYMENFPQLCGSVHSFSGNEREMSALVSTVKAAGDWTPHLTPTDLVLAPAACYPLYPSLSGALPHDWVLYDLTGYCYRNEPSEDPARMQCFQVHERICAGSASRVVEWRTHWSKAALALIESMGLEATLAVASDPFFGRGGRLLKQSQEAMELKFELLVPIFGDEDPTAVASFNYHEESFAKAFDIRLPSGGLASTACLGFGIERVAIALLKRHGLDPERWPARVQAVLWP